MVLERMEERGYTIKKFAAECEVSERTINNILSQKSSVTLDIAEKICEKQNFSIYFLFNSENQAESFISKLTLTDGESVYVLKKK